MLEPPEPPILERLAPFLVAVGGRFRRQRGWNGAADRLRAGEKMLATHLLLSLTSGVSANRKRKRARPPSPHGCTWPAARGVGREDTHGPFRALCVCVNVCEGRRAERAAFRSRQPSSSAA